MHVLGKCLLLVAALWLNPQIILNEAWTNRVAGWGRGGLTRDLGYPCCRVLAREGHGCVLHRFRNWQHVGPLSAFSASLNLSSSAASCSGGEYHTGDGEKDRARERERGRDNPAVWAVISLLQEHWQLIVVPSRPRSNAKTGDAPSLQSPIGCAFPSS